MTSISEKKLAEDEEADAKFAQLAESEGWTCTGCGNPIQRFEYEGYKIGGFCDDCRHRGVGA